MREPYKWATNVVLPNGEVAKIRGTVTGVGLGGVARKDDGVRARARVGVGVRVRARARARAGARVKSLCGVVRCQARAPHAQPVVTVLALSCRRRSTTNAWEGERTNRLPREKNSVPLLRRGVEMEVRGGHQATWGRRLGAPASHAGPSGNGAGLLACQGEIVQGGVAGLWGLAPVGRRLVTTPGGVSRGVLGQTSRRGLDRHGVWVDRWGVRKYAGPSWWG